MDYDFPLVGRCHRCGQFVARGIISVSNHDMDCPERRVVLWDGDNGRIVKQKEL